jgi:uncharacterized membrane protein
LPEHVPYTPTEQEKAMVAALSTFFGYSGCLFAAGMVWSSSAWAGAALLLAAACLLLVCSGFVSIVTGAILIARDRSRQQ